VLVLLGGGKVKKALSEKSGGAISLGQRKVPPYGMFHPLLLSRDQAGEREGEKNKRTPFCRTLDTSVFENGELGYLSIFGLAGRKEYHNIQKTRLGIISSLSQRLEQTDRRKMIS